MSIDIKSLEDTYPIISNIKRGEEIFWKNSDYLATTDLPFSMDDVLDAEQRLARFAPYIEEVFPETKQNNGKIESQIFH